MSLHGDKALPGRHTPGILFKVGDECCRLELTRLHSIAPWAELEAADDADLVGWLHLAGQRVPVIDLNALVYGEATPRQLGSRILILPCTFADGSPALVGALASEVIGITREGEDDTVERFDPCELLPSILRRLQ